MKQAFQRCETTRRTASSALAALSLCLFSTACSHSAPLSKIGTNRGEIGYTLHSPDTAAKQRVIIAHGFLRNAETMDHLAKALAADGIETACIALKRSKPWAGDHAENARDMIALREALGWKNASYAGFSAGGLSALAAASGDPACRCLVLLDPVDHKSLGLEAARKVRVPTLAILGQPGSGNANRNAAAMLAAIPGCRIIELPDATHCDFEARPSALCHFFTGSKPDASRTAAVHEAIFSESSRFLNHQTATEP
jgi:pimeloyl-ACP methyl ester carboxylesterase